jgi:hypothetical protein
VARFPCHADSLLQKAPKTYPLWHTVSLFARMSD